MDHPRGLQLNTLSSSEADTSASDFEINRNDPEAQYAQWDAERRAWHNQRNVSEDPSCNSDLQLSSDSSSNGRMTCGRRAASSRQWPPRTPRQFQAISGIPKPDGSSDNDTNDSGRHKAAQRQPRRVCSALAQEVTSPHAHRRQPLLASSCDGPLRCFD